MHLSIARGFVTIVIAAGTSISHDHPDKRVTGTKHCEGDDHKRCAYLLCASEEKADAGVPWLRLPVPNGVLA